MPVGRPISNDLPLPKRLLFVLPARVAYRVFLSDLAQRLAERECEVFLACGTDPTLAGPKTPLNAVCHQIPIPRGADPVGHFRAALALRRIVKTLRPDLVHAHFSAAILTTALAKQRDWPSTIATYQGLIHPFEVGMRRLVFRATERWSASRMDETFVLTSDDFDALHGIKRVRLQSSPGFGADQGKFSPALYEPSLRAQVRNSLGIFAEDIVFIFVGRQTQFKGFPETVRGFGLLADLKCHLVIIGTPDKIHSSGLSETELAAARNNPHIHFIGWTNQVAEYLLAADAMIFPSEREGMSVSIMESLSMATPVITTNARGCGDLVRHEKNGLIITKSAEDVASAMQRFAGDSNLREQLASTAENERHVYARNRYVEEQIEVYARLCNDTSLLSLEGNAD